MFRFPPPTRLLKTLVGGLAALFVIEALADNWFGLGLTRLLALEVGSLSPLALLNIVTYPLAVFSPSVFAVLIQLFFIWWIIGDYERNMGTETTILLIGFVSLFTGAVCFLAGLALPIPRQVFAGPWPMITGAIASMCWRLRGHGTLSLYGVIPMKAEHLLYGLAGLSLVNYLVSKSLLQLIASFASLGGGILFTEWTRRGGGRRMRKKVRRGLRAIDGGRKGKSERWMN